MFDIFYIGKKPNLFIHEQQVESIVQAQKKTRTRFFWVVSYLCDYSNWDFLWEPVPWQSHQCHAWSSQWQKDSGTYLVPRVPYQDVHYHADRMIPRLADIALWSNLNDIDIEQFDFSWHPDPTDPPMIYQFGTQHQVTGGPRFATPGAMLTKYISQPRAKKISTDAYWQCPDNVNHESFDWTWHPDDRDPPYIYQFPTQWNRAGGPVYCVPGATSTKYVTCQTAKMLPTSKNWEVPAGIDLASFDFSWTPDITEQPFVYQFGTQHQVTGGPRYIVPGAESTKFVSSPRAKKISRDDFWEIPDDIEFDQTFDWTWHPDDRDPAFIYQFGTQHQRTGGPRYQVPGAVDIKYIEQLKITVTKTQVAACIIDHLCGNRSKVEEQVKNGIKIIRTTRFVDSYLGTLKRIVKTLDHDHEFLWIVSSLCDYSQFDWTWHPEQWQASMLNVFASDGEKFGDTFFVHVPTFRDRIDQCELLEWYNCNFITDCKIARWPLPVVSHQDDSHVDAVKNTQWSGPLAVFSNQASIVNHYPCVPLWRDKTRAITPLCKGSGVVIIPRDAVASVTDQLYDYPYIDLEHIDTLDAAPLDIVFISNGESTTAAAFEALEKSTLWRPNRMHRIDGVNGRVAAYHAAAQASTTPWFFAVFAKLFVNSHFDWAWQPDRLQQPKHYIFHARNPVNGLEYGHQAMIAYNKKLALANPGRGLDFTLDDAHEVVPILSGVAFYADTPWMAWRTAFREALKLRASLPDVENEYRLEKWLTPSEVTNGNWSQWGAEDAVEYYESVAGDPDQLRLSYEWAWLASYAFMRRKLVPDQ